eukprot:9184760-Pyramimonas_sp.AAC.2
MGARPGHRGTEAQCGTIWHNVAQCGTTCHNVPQRHRGTKPQRHRGTMCHRGTEAQCATEAQRHRGTESAWRHSSRQRTLAENTVLRLFAFARKGSFRDGTHETSDLKFKQKVRRPDASEGGLGVGVGTRGWGDSPAGSPRG